jgi:hypothetical protein
VALRANAAITATSLIAAGVGACLLIANGDDSATVVRNARPPPKSTSSDSRDLSQDRIQRFNFGKVLIRTGAVLERDFKFTSDSADAIDIESTLGQPSCCVKATTTTQVVSPSSEFGLKLRIKPAPQPGRYSWRGVAKASKGPPFIAEVTAELIPTLHVVWKSSDGLEVDSGQAVLREGIVQFVGDHKPDGIASAPSDAGVRWTVGEWADRGRIEEISHHLWEASIRGECTAGKPGAYSTMNTINLSPNGEKLTFAFDWTTRSNWILKPRVIALSPSEKVGRVVVRNRRHREGAAPKIDAPSPLTALVNPSADGWELTVSARETPNQTLQTVKLQVDDETLSLSIIHVQTSAANGGPKP